MSDVEVLDAVPVETSGEVARNEKGQFAPGHGFSRKGSLNRVTRAMQEQLAREMESGGARANPLVILLRIAMKEDEPAAVRAQAADRLAKYLAPRLMQIEIEQPDQHFEVETQRLRSSLRALFLERPAE